MKENISKFWGLGLSLAVGTIVSTAILSKTFYDLKSFSQAITVKGYAEKNVTSEKGIVYCTLSVRVPILNDAYQKLNHAQDVLKETLKEFQENAINFESVQTIEMHKKEFNERGWERESNEIEYFKLNQRVSVSSDDLKKLKKLLEDLNHLQISGKISEDTKITGISIQYFYPSDKLEKLKLELISEATKNAKLRAEQFAHYSGAQVGRLLRARQGVFQVVGKKGHTSSSYDVYDTDSLEKTVKCVTDIAFLTK